MDRIIILYSVKFIQPILLMVFLFVDDNQAKDVRENPISVRLSKHQTRGEESS